MQTKPIPLPQKPKPKPPIKWGTVRFLEVTFGIAFLLATLFTAWTPNQPRPNLQGFLSLTPFPLQNTSPAPISTPRSKPAIGIVAGHYQHDAGAVCPDGLREVDVNLNVATLVQKRLVELGFDTDLLSEFDSRLVGYQAIALVSIHADSCQYINDQATGFKVAAAIGNKYPERAQRLTACLRSRYATITGMPLHSMSVTEDMTSYHAFGEIDENTPAAIIEIGFLNLDRQILTQKPELVAQGVINGILCFVYNESIITLTPPATLIPTP